MTKPSKKSNDNVIEVEVIEDNLEIQIETELVKHNVTDAVIRELKDKYGSLKLKDIDDKESYLEICEARKEVRKWGILCEKLTKKGREDAIAIQKKWLSKEKEVLGKIAEVQNPLDAEIKKYEDEIERKESEAVNRREEAYMKRQQQLLKYGATYQDGSFVLNHISYEATLVKESDDDIWSETILPKYLREYEKNEQERVAIEKKREEEALALKAQQEEMDRQRKELEEQQHIFREQQEQLRQQQEQAERNSRLFQEQEAKRKRDEETAILNKRVTQLSGVTWNGVTTSYSYNHEIITKQDEVLAMSDTDFELFKEKHNARVAKDVKEAAEKREIERAEQIRIAEEQAAKRERDRIAEEQRVLNEKRLKEEEENRLRMEQATDKEKWVSWMASVKQLPGVPVFKSASYKAKAIEVQKFLDKITNL